MSNAPLSVSGAKIETALQARSATQQRAHQIATQGLARQGGATWAAGAMLVGGASEHEVTYAAAAYVNPAFYGASPSASAAENAAALVAAAATGKHVVWDRGEFNIDPVTVEIGSGGSFSMRGHSRYGTKLIQATGGITALVTRTNTSITAGSAAVEISDMTFLANGSAVPFAFYLDYSSAVGSIIGGGTSCTVRNVAVGYYSSNATQYYTDAVKLNGISNAVVDDCLFRGPATPTGSAVRFTGASDAPQGSPNHVRNCLMVNYENGILVDARMEGFVANNNLIIGTNGIVMNWVGTVADPTEPGLQVLGGHINATNYGVYAKNWHDMTIADVLFYMDGPGIGVKLERPDAPSGGVSGPFVVRDCIFRASASPSTVKAIQVGAGMIVGSIHGNLFVNCGYGVELLAGSKVVKGSGNESYAGTEANRMIDNGTSNSVTVGYTALIP